MKSKMTFSSEKAKEESIKNMDQKIEVVKNKISSIKEKLNRSNVCSICYDEVNNTTISPCCNTKYCFECISTWLHQKKQCPFCRASIDFNSLIIVTDEPQQKKADDELLSKLTNLKNIIEKQMKNPRFKMLIFSEYNNSFTDIEQHLETMNIKYSYVNGTTNTANKTIRLFKDYESSDKIDVLLLNANHCANGINLENSTDIVLYHSMNKDRTTQIIGRGQRPGRVDQLNVWKLCYNNELDI
jgi:SNF2 family DNA or RNA helicase